MKVRQILDSKPALEVISISESASVSDAAALLSEKRIGCIVVTNASGKLAGILSERDIVRKLGSNGASCLREHVSDLMTRKVETGTPDDDSLSILERMTTGRFRHMPVMEDGELIGLISIGDVVATRIRELQRENSALEDLIRSATA